ncbi:MAG: hypoxanthine phosphoribosyltransferase [Planctomycetes bacterium]|nr:hypoxanthine phosphoribosyltransferase [Planctomycetota bacterium]
MHRASPKTLAILFSLAQQHKHLVINVPKFRILIANDQIVRRAREIANQIQREMGDEPPVLVSVIEGARLFARQIQLGLGGRLPVHEIRAASYGKGTTSSGTVQISGGPSVPVAGRTVILLEDIVDTGRTIAALRERFLNDGAKDCLVATLLSKPSRRVVNVLLNYVGFEIPDAFVIGYGMDIAGRYRELPDVVIYEAEVEQAAQSACS